MSRIVAAIDNSPAAPAVAGSMRVPYRVLPGGDPLPAILAHAAGDDVMMLVVDPVRAAVRARPRRSDRRAAAAGVTAVGR